MRLTTQDGKALWELSEGERQARDSRRGGRDPQAVPPPRVAAADAAPVSLQPDRADWARDLPADRATLHPVVGERLAQTGRALFAAACLHLPAPLAAGMPALQARFEGLEFQEFGYAGSPSFFAARTIASGYFHASPAAMAEPDSGDELLHALIRAVLRALPDSRPGAERHVGWMLSRHTTPVEAMPAHHDDVAWLAQISVHRSPGVTGGAVQLIDASGRVVEESLLARPFDGYIVRDADYMHAVTAMDMAGEDARRDVIVMRISEPI